MTILIVDALAANEGRRKFSRDAIGVGPRLLAGICEKNNKDAKIVRVEDILENNDFFNQTDFEVFLISGMSVDKIAVKRVIKHIYRYSSKSRVILGGPIVSDIAIVKEMDVLAGVVGEGESVLEDLIRSDFSFQSFEDNHAKQYELNRLQDIWLIKQNTLSTASIFDKYPASTDRITDYPDFWFSKVYVEITRGCSNHFRGEIVKTEGGCSDCGNCEDPDSVVTGDCPEDIPPGCGFCSVPATFGAPRSKSKNLILNEVEELFKKGVRRIILSSPGFFDYYRGNNEVSIFSPTIPAANLTIISELLEELVRLRDQQEEICSISIENVKPSLVTESLAKMLGKYLPGTAISIGCETFDTKHSSAIGRPASSNQALEAAKLFKNEGLDTQIYLIHSLPGETVKSLEITRKVIKEDLKDFVEKITVYKYLPLPNSPFTITNSKQPIVRHFLKEKREELKKNIIEFNKNKKRDLIGKKLDLIVAEEDSQRQNNYFAYPIFSGPAVSVYSEENILKQTVSAEITEVLSDRLVKGKIVRIFKQRGN